jgi:N-acetyl-gamma-glutamyl-phosphate reductase
MGAVLATAPLLKSGWGLSDGIVIDGKSGVTGPARKAARSIRCISSPKANENVQAYSVAGIATLPEIEQELSGLTGHPVVVTFTNPHLVPLNRGLFTTASVPARRNQTTSQLLGLYREFYAGEPFVRVLDEGTAAGDARGRGLELL